MGLSFGQRKELELGRRAILSSLRELLSESTPAGFFVGDRSFNDGVIMLTGPRELLVAEVFLGPDDSPVVQLRDEPIWLVVDLSNPSFPQEIWSAAKKVYGKAFYAELDRINRDKRVGIRTEC